jgi:hypothetical protein
MMTIRKSGGAITVYKFCIMNGYILYRKDQKTCLVLSTDSDDELYYLLNKLYRSRDLWLKQFAKELLADFFEKSNGDEVAPPVRVVQSGNQTELN